MLSPSRFYWQQVRRYTFGEATFRCSRRTFGHLRATQKTLAAKHPNANGPGRPAYIHVMQGCYHTGYKPSAGTHDEDCCVDVRIVGLSYSEAEAFFRWTGWAAWHRTTAQGFTTEHIHMISIPPLTTNSPTLTQCNQAFRARGLEVGALIPAQLHDYVTNDALGLKGRHNVGNDTTPKPQNIRSTIYMPKGA